MSTKEAYDASLRLEPRGRELTRAGLQPSRDLFLTTILYEFEIAELMQMVLWCRSVPGAGSAHLKVEMVDLGACLTLYFSCRRRHLCPRISSLSTKLSRSLARQSLGPVPNPMMNSRTFECLKSRKSTALGSSNAVLVFQFPCRSGPLPHSSFWRFPCRGTRHDRRYSRTSTSTRHSEKACDGMH